MDKKRKIKTKTISKQEKYFNNLLNGMSKKQAALDAGYALTVANNANLIEKGQGFQELLEKIDKKRIINRIEEIALDQDKRASLEACKELLKLLDAYPEKRLRVEEYKQQLKAVITLPEDYGK